MKKGKLGEEKSYSTITKLFKSKNTSKSRTVIIQQSNATDPKIVDSIFKQAHGVVLRMMMQQNEYL
jgi:hypothetical protein